MTKLHALPVKARISPRVRAAVEVRVKEGLSIEAAAARAGLSRNGFFVALKGPAVQDLVRQVQEAFVAEVGASKALYKARALEVALDLMLNAKSEAIRARMVEFLAGDGKQRQAAVHIDARHDHAGYEYARPGARVLEIEAAPGQGALEG